jgi:hypothetical protein
LTCYGIANLLAVFSNFYFFLIIIIKFIVNLLGISANIDQNSFRDYLQSLQGIGNLNIVRSKDCGGYKWRVKWVDGGDKLPISVKYN